MLVMGRRRQGEQLLSAVHQLADVYPREARLLESGIVRAAAGRACWRSEPEPPATLHRVIGWLDPIWPT